MDNIYLDYAATTPVDEEVFREIRKYSTVEGGLFGNPSSLHSFGRVAYTALENARDAVAREFNCHQSEVFFFSSATEANNFALRAVAEKYRKNTGSTPHIVVSETEHASVLETAKDMAVSGNAEISIVRPEEVEKTVRANTALISIMRVQNETGDVRDIAALSKEIIKKKNGMYPLVHTDNVQGYLYGQNVQELGVDMMTVSSHKIYGPKGAAALYIRGSRFDIKDIILPLMTGGGQEKGMRAGTENVQAIVGFAAALIISEKTRKKEFVRIKKLSERFIARIKEGISDVDIQRGDSESFCLGRSPHIISIRFSGVENFDKALDMEGIAASAGSACAQRAAKSTSLLRGSIRFSFGKYTTQDEVDEAVRRIILVYQNMTGKRSI